MTTDSFSCLDLWWMFCLGPVWWWNIWNRTQHHGLFRTGVLPFESAGTHPLLEIRSTSWVEDCSLITPTNPPAKQPLPAVWGLTFQSVWVVLKEMMPEKTQIMKFKTKMPQSQSQKLLPPLSKRRGRKWSRTRLKKCMCFHTVILDGKITLSPAIDDDYGWRHGGEPASLMNPFLFPFTPIRQSCLGL